MNESELMITADMAQVPKTVRGLVLDMYSAIVAVPKHFTLRRSASLGWADYENVVLVYRQRIEELFPMIREMTEADL